MADWQISAVLNGVFRDRTQSGRARPLTFPLVCHLGEGTGVERGILGSIVGRLRPRVVEFNQNRGDMYQRV